MKIAHGEFDIYINQQYDTAMVCTRLSDSFNAEGFKLWMEAMKLTITSLQGQPFVMLVDELSATGATPEALELANKYNTWLNSQAMIAKAVVYSAPIYREIDKKNIPARQAQNIKFFEKVSTAKAWLAQQELT
ncbi:hypothetical protein [Thalassotalea atypica]|uniref:hypothetical protein n=1 Tax=Thalassotalea atypica TaxID=2054316 RepID=UPI0025730C5B|nr:hypothetical protein [Thalassotalea atypica]